VIVGSELCAWARGGEMVAWLTHLSCPFILSPSPSAAGLIIKTRQPWESSVCYPAVLLNSSVTLGKVFNLSDPWYSVVKLGLRIPVSEGYCKGDII